MNIKGNVGGIIALEPDDPFPYCWTQRAIGHTADHCVGEGSELLKPLCATSYVPVCSCINYPGWPGILDCHNVNLYHGLVVCAIRGNDVVSWWLIWYH